MIRVLRHMLSLLICSWIGIPIAAATEIAASDTIAIICLNDFHGGFVQDKSLGIPGAGNVYTVVKRLKNRYPHNITIAVGDNFGGSFFSNQTEGKLVPYFFNKLGIEISAIGNHEFDNGQSFLAKKWEDNKPNGWNITYICSNVKDTRTNLKPEYTVSDTLCKMDIGGNTVKIRMLGLISAEAGSSTKAENVTGLKFSNQYNCILDSLCKKYNKDDLQVLVAHIGTKMNGNNPMWMENIARLPKSIKGIASGHSHKRVVGRIDNVPVVQGEINGKEIGVLRFIKQKKGLWQAIDPLLIEVGNERDMSKERAEIDSVITSNLEQATAPGNGMTCNIARVAKGGLKHDRNQNSNELTALGSYVCMSYAWAYRKHTNKEDMRNVVLAFSHFGGIRRSLPEGPIDIQAAGEVLPFANELRVYELTGKEIRKIIEAGIENKKGQLQMNNIVADTVRYENRCRVVNVHYVVPGKQDIILSDSEIYPVIVDEFVTTGGDGYSPSLFPQKKRRNNIKGLRTTPSFLNFLWTIDKEMCENYIYKGKMRKAL